MADPIVNHSQAKVSNAFVRTDSLGAAYLPDLVTLRKGSAMFPKLSSLPDEAGQDRTLSLEP